MSVQSPNLQTNSIQDPVVRKNFENLEQYFAQQGQLDAFAFMEILFSQAQKNFRPAHNLGVIPTDVILSLLVGTGSVTFNFGLFSKQNLDITVTGRCRVRFLFGVNAGATLVGETTQANFGITDAQTYSGGAGTAGG